jgi:hypothetical protein
MNEERRDLSMECVDRFANMCHAGSYYYVNGWAKAGVRP